MFSILPHILGVACILYSLQLLNMIRLDLKQRNFGDGLLAVFGGLLSLILTACIIVGIDMLVTFDAGVSEAMYFVRMSVLIPLSYLTAFIASRLPQALVGTAGPQNVVPCMTYLGVTLFFLAPIARSWLLLFIQE